MVSMQVVLYSKNVKRNMLTTSLINVPLAHIIKPGITRPVEEIEFAVSVGFNYWH